MGNNFPTSFSFGAIMPIRAVKVSWFSLRDLATEAGVTPTFSETEYRITVAHVAIQAVRDQVNNQSINPFDIQFAQYIVMDASGKITSLMGTELVTDETLTASSLTGVVYFSLTCTTNATTNVVYNPTQVDAVEGELALLTRLFVGSSNVAAYLNHYDALYKPVDANNTVTVSFMHYKPNSGVQKHAKNTNTFKHKVYWLNENGVYQDVTDDNSYCVLPTNGVGESAVESIDFTFTFLKDGMYAIYSYNHKTIPYNSRGAWCLVNCNVAEDSIDEEKLEYLQTLVTSISNGYYQENDRWNGITYCEDGYWATYMSNSYDSASNVLQNPLDNQSIINSINALLAVDKSKLISTNNLNTTDLYETLLRMDSNFPDSELTDYTAASASLFKTARTAEWNYLNSLFDETTHEPTADNDSANEAVYQQHLSAATNLYRILVDSANLAQYQAMIDGLPKLLSAFASDGLRDAAATEAYATAQELIAAAGGTAPDAEQMSGIDIKAWTDAYAALQAAAWGIAPDDSVTVSLRVADNYGIRWAGYGLGDTAACVDQSYTLTKENASLYGLLSEAGLLNPSYTMLDSLSQVGDGNASIGQSYGSMLLINGVNVSTTNVMDSALGCINPNSGNLNDVMLHEGDEVVLLTYAMSAKPEFSYGVSVGPLDYGHAMSLLDVTGTEEAPEGGYYTAETGAAATVTVTETGSWLPMYTGTASAAEGVEVMVSSAFGTKEEAQAAALSTARIKNPNSTPSGWKVVYTVSTSPYYDPDWLQGDAVVTDANGQAGVMFLEPGWYKVAVMDTRDADSTQALGSTGVYYSVKASDYLLFYVTSGNLEAVRQEYINTATTYFEGFHDYDFAGSYYTDTFKAQYDLLLEHLASATTETAMAAQFETDFALLKEYGATAYDHQGQVDAIRRILRYIPDDLTALDSGYASALEELQTLYAALSDHARTMMTASELEKLAQIAALDISALRQLPAVTVTIETQGTLPLKTGSGNQEYGSANVSWTATPGLDGAVSSPDWTLLGNPNSLNAKGGDHVFVRRYLTTSDEQYRLMWSVDGGETWATAAPQILVTADGTASYDGYFLVDYCIPRDTIDSSITLQLKMWSKAEYDSGDVDAAKAAAVIAVQEAYDSYDLTLYDNDGKAALQEALNDALDAIAAAASNEDVMLARKSAMAAMAAVPTITGNAVNSSYDSGTIIGRVYVTIENTTYNGVFPGTIAEGWYPLGENDSMMTVFLKVLEDSGFTWSGTGGTGDEKDYAISYLSGIAKGGKELAEFTAGSQSGWMATMNDWFVNEGLNMFSVANGKLENDDTLRLMYTAALGRDIGSVWGNTDTSLETLNVTGGSLSPSFEGSVKNYILTVPNEGAIITVYPSPVNKNYQSRIFLNNYDRDSALYKRTDKIPVKPGDVVYVGVGEMGWPTMNSGGQASRYLISVVSESASQDEIDAEKLAAAKTAIEAEDFTVLQETANDANALQTFAENKVAAMGLGSDISMTVTVSGVTPAETGTETNPNGTNGKYTISVALSLNNSSATATVSDAVITAVAWSAPETFTVTFDANGGTGTMAAQTVQADTETALNANTFKRSGFTFTGWNTKADGKGTAYANKAKVTLTADLTLYAQWKSTLSITSFTADKSTAAVGDSITWTVSAAGGDGSYKYCFYVYKDDAIEKKGSYTAANTFTFTPTDAGSWSVTAFVKDGTGKSVSLKGGMVTVVSADVLRVSSVKADKSSATLGDTVTWTATAAGGSGTLRYCFYVYKDGKTVFKGTYKASSVFNYTPEESGIYSVKAFVKDGTGTVATLVSDKLTVGAAALLQISSVKADKTSAAVGDTVTWTATAAGGSGTLRYCFYVYKDGKTVLKSGYKASSVFSYTPEESGVYSVKAFVKDGTGTVVTLVSDTLSVGAETPLAISSVKPNKTGAAVGGSVTWTTTAAGGTGTLRYCFYVYKDGKVIFKSGYQMSKTYSYTFTESGSYTVKGFVKDSAGKVVSLMSSKVTVK